MKMMSVAEIDAEIARLQKDREDVARAEDQKRKHDQMMEVRALTQGVVETLNRLDELGFVPPKIKEALTDDKGNFRPGRYIKKPRLAGDNQPGMV